LNGTPGVRHTPKPLREATIAEAGALVRDGCRDRLVLYLGAGVSVPWPACGPGGNQIADRLRPIAAELLGVAESEVTELTLETLGARVARDAPERLAELKDRAAGVWPLREMEPTYGHEIVALLIREGLVRVVSANWDCGVENGGRQVEVSIEGVSRDIDVLNLADGALPLYKIHGCARRPETLVLTREEVDEPRRWARAKVESALTGGTVVFVGLGTVGGYVGEPVQELTDLWTAGATVRLVDPYGLSEEWREVLGDHAEDVTVRLGADEFLDDLARAAVSEAISQAGEQARNLHEHEQKPWSEATVTGHGTLRAALAHSPADAILRWWRGGVTPARDGQRFIMDRAGQVILMCVAQLAAFDGGVISAAGSEGALTIRTDRRYFESACRPLEHLTNVERSVRARIERRRRNGCYAPGTPITVAIEGATGEFPHPSAPADIAAGDIQDSDIGAGGQDALRVVRAEDALNGKLAG
jgi:hypothetical protein